MNISVSKEIPFKQKFDIIIANKRLTLDFEKEKYPEETVTFYLNGTTGKFSINIKDVIRKKIPYIEESFANAKQQQKAYSIEYSEELKMVVFHFLRKDSVSRIREGVFTKWIEFDRFMIDKDFNCYSKENGIKIKRRGYCSIDFNMTVDENCEYIKAKGYDALPILPSSFSFSTYVNAETGESNGFMKEIAHIFPAIFNVTGNEYSPLSNYVEMAEYLKCASSGFSCVKKTGNKQNIIDELLKYNLPDVKAPLEENLDFKNSSKIYKFAVIQKLPELQNTCVIRTFNYIVGEKYLFEGGRIYVDKTINFCKVNNMGEYVAQPLLNKMNHWDFELAKFPEEETKGTILEYFGHIVPEISPENRSIAIWMFLKNNFMESLAKISPASFIDEFINALRDNNDMDKCFVNILGIDNNRKDCKKIFQLLGVNKNQFDILKEYICECMPIKKICGSEEFFSFGLIPFLKNLLTGNETADISSYDIKTFEEYLDFSLEIYSIFRQNIYFKEDVFNIIKEILNMRRSTLAIYPDFDFKYALPIMKYIAFDIVKNKRRYNFTYGQVRIFNDYLAMASRMEEKERYKPKFSSYQDLVNMHDNLSIIIDMSRNPLMNEKFKIRYETWKNWEFDPSEKKKTKKSKNLLDDNELLLEDEEKEKKKKDNNKEKEEEIFKFIVIAPKHPLELAKEGTALRHCVKSYCDKVAEGETNVLFIRKKDNPTEPFFTVEISNGGIIEQVHGLCNSNADSEPHLLEFLNKWAKAKRLKFNTINKMR